MNTLEQRWLELASQWRPAGSETREGRVWKSAPSNIALVKYWGKKEGQIPRNPSLSMTLELARTDTKVRYRFEPGGREVEGKGLRLDFRFEGEPAPEFARRIQTYLERLGPFLPFLTHSTLEIDSSNSFPHSTGIASSASSMAALALCLLQMTHEIAPGLVFEDPRRQASFLARLGSGSACRSVFPGMVVWGHAATLPGSSDEHGLPLEGVHSEFAGIRNSILVVDSSPKTLSSRAGHGLMEGHLFAPARYGQARRNLDRLLGILRSGDWDGFVDVVEEEALSLHAMIMTSRPGTLLMKPGTIAVLQRARELRRDAGLTLACTMDAGANVHLIYPPAAEDRVRRFITDELGAWLADGQVIHDRIAEGPDGDQTSRPVAGAEANSVDPGATGTEWPEK